MKNASSGQVNRNPLAYQIYIIIPHNNLLADNHLSTHISFSIIPHCSIALLSVI